MLIILGIIFSYALIDEYAKGGGFSSPFGLEKRVESRSPSPKTTYYTSGTQSGSGSDPAPSTTSNYIGKVKIYL